MIKNYTHLIIEYNICIIMRITHYYTTTLRFIRILNMFLRKLQKQIVYESKHR